MALWIAFVWLRWCRRAKVLANDVQYMKKILLFSFLIVSLLLPAAVFAFNKPPVNVVLLENNEKLATYKIPSGNNAGGLSVSVADLGDDDVAEIVIGNGLGNEPRVRVLRTDGSEIGSFLAYDKAVGIGVHVLTCDLDADGYQEIIVAPERGGGPHIRVFSRYGKAIDNGGFFAYAPAVTTGVNLACGNLDNIPGDELVTTPGPAAGPHVKVWKWNAETSKAELWQEFFDGEQTDDRGRVAVVHQDLLTVLTQKGSAATQSTYNLASGTTRTEQHSISLPSIGANNIFFHNNELMISGATGGSLYNAITGETTNYESPFGSIAAASGDLTGDGKAELVVVPYRPLLKDYTEAKHILVDLSEQRMYAYENGLLSNTFLVSTAKSPFETPIGEHSVLAKLDYVHYKWSYGANNPNNYDLGLIPYNLRIYPHIYIHYAPWHNNFGEPMSHGCINVNLENSQWIYAWANEGIPVTVQE